MSWQGLRATRNVGHRLMLGLGGLTLSGCALLPPSVTNLYSGPPIPSETERSAEAMNHTFFSADEARVYGAPPPVPTPLSNNIAAIAAPIEQTLGEDVDFVIWDCDAPTAFVNSAGEVGICRGLLEETDYDDELAFVIAHEVGHWKLGHASLLAQLEAKHGERQKRRDRTTGAIGAGSAAATGALLFGTTILLPILWLSRQGDGDDFEYGYDAGDEPSELSDNLVEALLATTIRAGQAAYKRATEFANQRQRDDRIAEAARTKYRAPSDEMAADTFAFDLLDTAGYDPGAGAYALSKVPDAGSPDAYEAPVKDWDLLGFAFPHPASSNRIQKLAEMTGGARKIGPQAFAPCYGSPGQTDCSSWIDALEELKRLQELAAIVARSTAAKQIELRTAACHDAETSLSLIVKALGPDRKAAVLASYLALYCPGDTWNAAAMAPLRSTGYGGYRYLRQLATVLWLRGQPGEAYEMATLAADLAGESAVAYIDFTTWARGIGFFDLAERAMERCVTVTMTIALADRGEFCTEMVSADPAEREQTSIRYGFGPTRRTRKLMLERLDAHLAATEGLELGPASEIAAWLLDNAGQPGDAKPPQPTCLKLRRIVLATAELSAASLWTNPHPGCFVLPGAASPKPSTPLRDTSASPTSLANPAKVVLTRRPDAAPAAPPEVTRERALSSSSISALLMAAPFKYNGPMLPSAFRESAGHR
ncbi:M48 family metalloprotease [Phenylobacterium sp.]|uniref:M48 family metalloprotease n=1 Tax=Phenylobacterium sp. TaxID=1871053 RepID=UPI003D26F5AE